MPLKGMTSSLSPRFTEHALVTGLGLPPARRGLPKDAFKPSDLRREELRAGAVELPASDTPACFSPGTKGVLAVATTLAGAGLWPFPFLTLNASQ